MSAAKLFVLTGATSGLGLDIARTLAREPEVRLIVGARNPSQADRLRLLRPANGLSILPLDLEDLASVAQFAKLVATEAQAARIDGIACNAGLQLTGPLALTAGGVERTFAANHLGHFALVHLLLPLLAPGAAVVATGSGTHDPKERLATRFGFRGGLFPSARQVATGVLDPKASVTQQGMDRYATSKLCNILFTFEMARRVPAEQARFLVLDPGLMPGTGLARDRSAIEQFGWSRILPAVRFVMSGVSTPARSGSAYVQILTGKRFAGRTGLHADFTLKETPTSETARRDDLARDLYNVSVELTGVAPLSRMTVSAA